jgi:hypothetical protein
MTRGLRQTATSGAIFGMILLALVSIDARVRQRVSDLVTGGDGLTPWADRAGELGSALADAIRHQSIENAPLLISAPAGAVLFAFMVRT